MAQASRRHKPSPRPEGPLPTNIAQLEGLLFNAAKDYVAAVQENAGDSNPESYKAVLAAKLVLHQIGAAWYKAVYLQSKTAAKRSRKEAVR